MHAKHLLFPAVPFLAAASFAQGTPPPIPVELRSRFGFDGPMLQKVGDGIGGLQIADVDGDGRKEVVVQDGRRARLAVLHVKDGAVTVDSRPTEGQIAGYTFGDAHGDGKPDLLLLDGRGRLVVKRADGTAAAPLDLGMPARGAALRVGDLDGDGKQDLVVFTKGGLRCVTHLAEAPVLSPIEPLEENVGACELLDLDGDHHLDLVCSLQAPTANVRVRLGHGDGSFGPWQITTIDTLHSLFAARLPDGGAALATIQGPHRRVALQRFADHGGTAPLSWWPLGEAQAGKAMPFVLGDIDGDGDEDVVLAPPDKAQLLVFLWQDGAFQPRTVPTLAGVTSLAIGDVDHDGKPDLVLASPEEDTLAWKPGSAPLDRFPTTLRCTDKPVAAAIAADGSIVVIARNDKRDAHLDRVVPEKEPVRIVDLGRLPADPSRLLLADVGDAPGDEAAFVVPGEGLRVVTLAAADPAAKPAKPAEAAGFTKKMDDGSLSTTTFDGKPALVAVRDRYVRTFRIDARGQLAVLAQDNGPAGTSELGLAATLPGGDRLYLDKKAGKLVRAAKTGAPTSLDVPGYEFTHLAAHGDAALLVGPRGLLRVPFGSGPSLREVAGQEPPTDRTFWWYGQCGDFDHDGAPDLALLDGRLPGVQILAGGTGGLQRALAIPVYEAPPSLEPETEPRELRVGDVDGDGRDDLVLLAFDRVLIYLQPK